jgi:uncharacterized membrane protein
MRRRRFVITNHFFNSNLMSISNGVNKHKYDTIIILALIGFGVSLYLSITHYLGFTVPCNITHGCEVVLNSKYAVILGVPLSLLGVFYFTGVIVSALLASHYVIWRKLLTVLLGLGALAALAFLTIQFFVLKKVCQYCLITDVISLLIFILDLNWDYKNLQI